MNFMIEIDADKRASGYSITMQRLSGFLILTIVTVLAFAGISSPNVLAQSGAGSIQGTVADSTGAVIPHASIKVVNQATSVAANTTSNGVGFYQVPGLFTGIYQVTFTAPNMKTYVRTIDLLVNQTAVVNAVMTAGAITQQINVTSNAVQLTDTTSGALTSVLDSERIDQLPMNGRLITTLAQETTPGLESGFGPGTRANGLGVEAIEYVADGVPLDNRQFGGANVSSQAQYPDSDSVQEMTIAMSGSGAQFATPATGIITTKSGTNQLHGTAFWTGRNNSAAGIAKGRQNLPNFSAPNYKRNEFGVSAGGPINIPHLYHGKDKSFWFLAYERYSLIQTAVTAYAVDTPAIKGGDFSGLINSSGVLQQLYDPSTTRNDSNCNGSGTANTFCRTPFANNQIPAARLNSLAKLMYEMTPAPTPSLANVDPLVAPNYDWPGPNLFFVPTITFRLDHNFTENDKAYLRYTSAWQTDQYPGGYATTLAAGDIPAMAASSETIAPSTNFAAAIGYTHVFSPTFFSETVASQQWFAQPVTATGDHQRLYKKELGLPDNFGEPGFPGIGGFIMGHNGNQYYYGMNQIISNLDENLTKTWGKHQAHFGFRYRHERLGYQPDQSLEAVTADNLSTALYNTSTGGNYGALASTGHSAADAYLGSFYNFTVANLPPYTHFRDQEFDAYFQDDYHVTENLTLNLGLRWEDVPAMTSGGIGSSFDLANDALVLENPASYYISKGLTSQAIISNLQSIGAKIETPSEAGMPSVMLKSYNFTFGPRAGFAWQPFANKWGTVVRGAYGRYIYPEAIRNLIAIARNTPYLQGYGYNNNSASQDPDSLPNYELRYPQNLFAGQNTTSIVDTTTTTAILPGVGGTFLNPNFPPLFVTEANFTVEQPFKGNSALRISWNWTHSTNLTHGFYPNVGLSTFAWEYTYGTLPPNGGASTIGTCQYAATALNIYDCKTFGNFGYLDRNGWSNDNALQVNYQRFFHHGLAYQVMYVYQRPFRVGGNSTRESLGYPIQSYLGVLGTAPGTGVTLLPGATGMTTPAQPPPLPSGAPSYADYHALNRFQNYKVDPYFSGLFHHVTITGIYDLPIGRGKWLLGNANRFIEELAGGWQIAGDAQILSQNFSPNPGNWGPVSKLVTYKNGVSVNDCSSGVCRKERLWFNGYISPKLLPPSNGGVCGNHGETNCITGLPASYQPYQTPINNAPYLADGNTANPNFGNNNVQLTTPSLVAANKGAPVTVAFAPDSQQTYAGSNPFNKTVLNGPFNYNVDFSVFKVFPIKERMNVRVNVDAFNAFNIQGYSNPNTTSGLQTIEPGGVGASSYWTPRQLQLTMRFTF